MVTIRTTLRRARGYLLAFACGSLATLALLLTHGVSLGTAILSLGDRVAMAGGAEPVLTRDDIDVIVTERMAEYARAGVPKVLKVAKR